MKLSWITPDGQVTIPRSVMKSLGISGESELIIEVENGRLVLKKIEASNQESKKTIVSLAG